MERFDAIVIGGGPAGATAAFLLARAGWRVAVVERATFPRRKVCGEFISATTWPLLDAMGIGPTLARDAGPPVARVGVFAARRSIVAPLPGTLARRGRALGRERLDTALLDLARDAGAAVFQPWSLAAYREEGELIACTIAGRAGGAPTDAAGAEHESGTKQIAAGVLIAAHGAWEHGVLPTQRPRRAPRDSDLLGFKSRFRGARLPADLMPLLAFPGGYGGLVATSDGRTSLSCCIRRDALARARARHPLLGAGDAVLAHIVAHSSGAAEALAGARRDGPWLGAGPLATGIRSFGTGRVIAIGNAAAEAHPIVAEGITMAIQSAHLACEALVAHVRARGASLDDAALDRARRAYARGWRRNFALRLSSAACYAHLFMRPTTAAIAAAVLGACPALLAAGAHWSGKQAPFRPLGAFPATAASAPGGER